MGAYPKGYSKEKFIEFLKNNNVSECIIDKFKSLPEFVVKNGKTYKLNIISTWYSLASTYYSFELNYYSEELVEFLFTYKIFNDISKSVDYLMSELINGKYIV